MTGKRYRIVCVEDDRDTRDMISLWLRYARFDYEVDMVDTASQMTAIIERHESDLYVLDSSVGNRCPVTLLESIRRKDHDTPILIFSGQANPVEKDAAFAAGASEYLTKPAESEQFVEAVERLLHQA